MSEISFKFRTIIYIISIHTYKSPRKIIPEYHLHLKYPIRSIKLLFSLLVATNMQQHENRTI